MAKYDLKPEQRQAIEARGTSVLVSASAGSGKTFVMIERIVSLICNDGANLSNMLVVTFTNAAAQDMRSKLEERLNELLSDSGLSQQLRGHLEEQLVSLSTADVCTFHAFCKKIITKYFYLVGLDSGFGVADTVFSNNLATLAAENVLAGAQAKGSEEFAVLSQAFSGKRNLTRLAEVLIELHNFLVNQTDEGAFISAVKRTHDTDLDINPACVALNRKIVAFSVSFKAHLNSALTISRQANFDALTDFINFLIAQLDAIRLDNGFIKNRELVANFNTGRLSLKPRNEAENSALEVVKQVKDSQNPNSLPKQLTALKQSLLLPVDLDTLKADLKSALSTSLMLVNFVDEFKREYARLKREKNALDFNDLEAFVLEVLKFDEATSEIVAEYKHVFVDEYQDTNNVQEAILSKVAKKDNLFIVGDVKQSIYGFRNTNPEIFVGKNTEYRQGRDKHKQAIELNYNFRSDNQILQFVNYIFSELMTQSISLVDYKETGMFKEGLKLNLKGELGVEINVVKTHFAGSDEAEEQESKIPDKIYSVKDALAAKDNTAESARAEARIIASYIAEKVGIKQLPDEGKKSTRAAGYGDIVILMRSQKDYTKNMLAELSRLGVPLSVNSSINLLDFYEIQVLHSFLLLLDNDLNDVALATVCLSSIIGLTEADLVAIRGAGNGREFYSAIAEYRQRTSDKMLGGQTYKTINEGNVSDRIQVKKANDKTNEKSADDSIKTRLEYLFALIEKYRTQLITDTLFDVVSEFIEEVSWVSIALSLHGGRARETSVNTYLNCLRTTGEFGSLEGYLGAISASDNVLNAEQAGGGDAGVVRVETMHRSKGREFPIVILAGLGNKFNIDSRRGDILTHAKLGIGMYSYDLDRRLKNETLARTGIKEELSRTDFSEELRLFYVACTRAKNHLMLVGGTDVVSLISRPDEFRARRINNLLQLTLSVIGEAEIEAIKQGKRKLVINKDKPCEFNVNLYSLGEFSDAGDLGNSIKLHNLGVADMRLVERLEEYCDYEYPHAIASEVALKNTVTKLLAENEERGALTVSAPRQFRLNEGEGSWSGAEMGNAYHHAMEVVDYALEDKEKIAEDLAQKLSDDELKLIDCSKIEKCLISLRTLGVLLADARVYREQRFYMLKKHSDLVGSSKVDDKVLVQGTIDLLVETDANLTLVDFKTTRATSPSDLTLKYKIQLHAYKIAAESALNKRVTKIFIYSFYFDKLILFDI